MASVLPACDGCLGSQRCWVCLGHGVLEAAQGEARPCVRCSGTGACPLCQPAAGTESASADSAFG